MLSRNLLLIGIIVGCMLLVLYSSYYGTIMSKRMTEGFATESWPVIIHFVKGKVESGSEFAEINDTTNDIQRYSTLFGELYQYVSNSENANVYGKIEIKDTSILQLRENNKSELLTFQNNVNLEKHHGKQPYTDYIDNYSNNSDVFNIFVFPVISDGNLFFSEPNTEYRNDRNYYVGKYKYNANGNPKFQELSSLSNVLKIILKKIAQKPGVMVEEDSGTGTGTGGTGTGGSGTGTGGSGTGTGG